jgi:hypothetical protein
MGILGKRNSRKREDNPAPVVGRIFPRPLHRQKRNKSPPPIFLNDLNNKLGMVLTVHGLQIESTSVPREIERMH